MGSVELACASATMVHPCSTSSRISSRCADRCRPSCPAGACPMRSITSGSASRASITTCTAPESQVPHTTCHELSGVRRMKLVPGFFVSASTAWLTRAGTRPQSTKVPIITKGI